MGELKSEAAWGGIAERPRRWAVTGIGAVLVAAVAACHPGPIANPNEMQVGGTIAGHVAAAAGGTPLPSRRVIATNLQTRATFDVTTSSTGGYTLKVPEGTYRLEVELRPGEALAKRPDDTEVNNGDLDPGRDFELTVQ